MPPDERPRQRLLRSGGDSLSDAEVLAVVLGNGSRNVCTLELAREILEEAGGLHGLVGVRADALQRRGLGEAKAASVLANLEIARRLAEGDLPDRVSLSRPLRWSATCTCATPSRTRRWSAPSTSMAGTGSSAKRNGSGARYVGPRSSPVRSCGPPYSGAQVACVYSIMCRGT